MELFYDTYGDGPPLIILHGLFGLSDNWVTIARRISANYTVFIPDQRNHGQSPHADTFNYYALADDLMEFMDEHDIQKPVLMGHSMGGKVAMNFALDYPENVDKLIIVDMSVRQYKARAIHYRIIEAMESVDFKNVKNRKDVEHHLKEYIPQKPLRLFIMKNLKRYSKNQMGWKLNLPVLKESMDTIVEGIDTNQRFDNPSLFIGGGKSDYIEKQDHELIKSIFTNAEIKEIPEASHWIHADAPEVFCAIVSDFLKRNCKSMDDLLNESR